MAMLAGLITGFVICIPIGPLGAGIVNTFLKKGKACALAIALGGSTMDFIYFMVILTGLSFVSIPDSANHFMQLSGSAVIVALGLKDVFNKTPIQQNFETGEVKKRTLFGHFVVGMVIYGSNPTLLLTMTAIATYLRSFMFWPGDLTNNLLLSIGLGLGSFAWFFSLLVIIEKYRHKFSPQGLGRFSQISGVGMVIVGTSFIIRAFVH